MALLPEATSLRAAQHLQPLLRRVRPRGVPLLVAAVEEVAAEGGEPAGMTRVLIGHCVVGWHGDGLERCATMVRKIAASAEKCAMFTSRYRLVLDRVVKSTYWLA